MRVLGKKQKIVRMKREKDKKRKKWERPNPDILVHPSLFPTSKKKQKRKKGKKKEKRKKKRIREKEKKRKREKEKKRKRETEKKRKKRKKRKSEKGLTPTFLCTQASSPP